MERQLAAHLRACADAYSVATSLGLTTIAQRAAGDWRFFARLEDAGTSFTARKYDSVMAWFAANWPAGVRWPKGVPRPQDDPDKRRGGAAPRPGSENAA